MNDTEPSEATRIRLKNTARYKVIHLGRFETLLESQTNTLYPASVPTGRRRQNNTER